MLTFRKNDLIGVWTVFGPASEVRIGEVQVKKEGEFVAARVLGVVQNHHMVRGVPYTYGLLAKPKVAPQQCRKCGTLAFYECFDRETRQAGYACPDCLSAYVPARRGH